MTIPQAKKKFYTEYAEGSRSMADAELQVQLVRLENDMARNIKRAERKALWLDKQTLAEHIN
jgi:hypothetical protein